jgi:TnpA family transposase
VRKLLWRGFPHMLVGYMRISTDGDRQVLDLQRDALLSAGVDERHLFEDRVRAHWSDILRIVASISTGTVTASLIMRQLASHPRQNGVAAALRELGRLERTLLTLEWIDDPELRRTTGHELNKGESRNSLARAVFIHRLGEIRDRTYENQQHRVSGLQSARYRHYPVEHALPGTRRRRPAPG